MSTTVPGPVDPICPTSECTTGRRWRSTRTAELLDALAEANDPAECGRLREQVILANTPVADAVASRYRNRGVPVDDLRQVAYEGLVKAVDRFDPGRHHDLLSYAVPTMRGEVQRYFRDLGWAVRPPRSVQERQYHLHRTTAELRQQLGREPERHEVRAAAGLTEEDYEQALAAYGAFQPVSLDRPLDGSDDDGPTPGDRLTGAGGEESATETRLLLAPALRRLPPRDRHILYRRFWQNRTQREIGAELGITQTQISRVLTRILRDLRSRIGDPE